MKKLHTLAALALCALLISSNVHAQAQKVVVIPLIGNDSELKPLNPDDVIHTLGVFTTLSNRVTLGNVTDERGFVLTSILVSPEQYPSTYDNIRLRFCRSGGGCSHSLNVPNNTMTNIEYGLGDIFSFNGLHYIEVSDRGGLPENVSNQIIVHISGYYFDK